MEDSLYIQALDYGYLGSEATKMEKQPIRIRNHSKKLRRYEVNLFNDGFKEFISALNFHNVDYILIGGYSVILHGYCRTTGYLDLWV